MTIILVLLLILTVAGLIYVAFQLLSSRKKSSELETELRNQKTKYDIDTKQLTDYANDLRVENQRLSRWKGVADADAKAAELLLTARAALDKATSDAAHLTAEAQQHANTLITNAQNDATTISTEARQQAKTLKDEANESLSSATSKAFEIIAAADKKAEEIAGSAYEAMKNASLYELTVKAMKNIIEGYGDQYIIPGRSLLDDLAEDFGHTQAGQQLKSAREQTKVMIRNGTAATCDYVETNRRYTAINFVIDAFNGKVDSILSRVRHDNAGTLGQEIRDAFTLVNLNGKAFREARITEEYLSARLAELKWAAISQQLRLEEREEQRRIKEQIREEEKVRRECERAMRDAAKDEDLLRKAMEKAQQQIEKASAEQKVKYEQQLLELTQKLKEAEERSQRALSMAQQTKRGHVYVISNIGSFGENVYKIGLTRRLEPLDRIRELGDSSVPFAFDVHALLFSEDAPALETRLHRHFLLMQINKVNFRKEFFRTDVKDIRNELEKLGITANWTMTAEAAEYRESLAIEKAIAENPTMRESWLRRQLEFETMNNDIPESAEAATLE
jgi:hypothetical protein